MRKKIFAKILFFLLLMVPVCVNAADYMICGNNKRIPLVFGQVFSIIFIIIRILVPLLLVIMSTITFFKAIFSGKVDDELKKAKDVFIHRIIAAVIIFFIVSIANFVIGLAVGTNNSFSSCLNCMIHPDNCGKDNGEIAKLCPGLISQQNDYDDNCNYIGDKKERTDYSNTGDTKIPNSEKPSNNNSNYSNNYSNNVVTNNSSSNIPKPDKIDVKKIDGVTYFNGILIVNKSYSMPASYKPTSALNMDICKYCFTEETRASYNEMVNAAKNDGISLDVVSGFRSYETQNQLYNGYVSRDGKEAADTYSARPGHSEHQTGLAFDVNLAGDAFNNTPEAKWVNDNCYKYGFIIRYPKGKTNYTGYKYESWHLRYVGKELAEILYNNGDWVTLEEYFNLTSEYGA